MGESSGGAGSGPPSSNYGTDELMTPIDDDAMGEQSLYGMGDQSLYDMGDQPLFSTQTYNESFSIQAAPSQKRRRNQAEQAQNDNKHCVSDTWGRLCGRLCSIWGQNAPAVLEVCTDILFLINASSAYVRASSNPLRAFVKRVGNGDTKAGLISLQNHISTHLPALSPGKIYRWKTQLEISKGSIETFETIETSKGYIELEGVMLMAADGSQDVVCCLKESKSSPRVSIESNPLDAYPWIESGVKSEWYRTGKEDGSTSPTPEIPNSIAP